MERCKIPGKPTNSCKDRIVQDTLNKPVWLSYRRTRQHYSGNHETGKKKRSCENSNDPVLCIPADNYSDHGKKRKQNYCRYGYKQHLQKFRHSAGSHNHLPAVRRSIAVPSTALTIGTIAIAASNNTSRMKLRLNTFILSCLFLSAVSLSRHDRNILTEQNVSYDALVAG